MKGLIQITLQPKNAFILVFLVLNFYGYAEENLRYYESSKSKIGNSELYFTSSYGDDNLFTITKFYNKTNSIDSINKFKILSFKFAQERDAINAYFYIEKYIKATLNVNFIHDDNFNNIKNTTEFNDLEKKYCLSFSVINLFYLYVSLIGLFIAFIINLRKSNDKITNFIISFFIFMHSVFIFHIFTYKTNLNYRFPHILFMSTSFSFLYGPALYFYFKRATQQYSFKKIDLLHLLPSLVVLAVIFPNYLLPVEEKLKIIMHVSAITSMSSFIFYIVIFKLLSLVVYGYLLLKMYNANKVNNKNISILVLKWQKTITWLVIAYIISYAIYGLIISKVLPSYEILFHLQVILMSIMVLYIGFASYLKPSLFTRSLLKDQIEKYKKSGLTKSYSEELKVQLLILLQQDKIFKQNDISLEKLSESLGTTRHNASQVINEHFNSNFFELINVFRIKEAQEILKNDSNNNLNIIDVAYEVGFNNKVTFNKSFKKQLEQTPTQYINSLQFI